MYILQPTLENELVLLRPLLQEDFESLYEVASDPLIWEQHQNPDRWKKEVFEDFFQGALDSKGALAIFDAKTSQIIGSSRFKPSERSEKAVEIGWTFLSRGYWGGTYNKSFKTLMLNHAFKYFDYVLFHVNENNLRSQKAVRKLGGKLGSELTGDLSYLNCIKRNTMTFILSKLH